MTRENIVSIRLTDAERAQLAVLGRPTDVLREAIRSAFAPPLPVGASVGYTAPRFVWHDGLANGGTWPEENTR